MLIIGELINGMFKKVGHAIEARNKAVVQAYAHSQVQAGAAALDVNCGPASKDPVSDIRWLVETIQEVTDVPLSIDSSRTAVIEAGLDACRAGAFINSTTADAEKLDVLVPLALKHNAKLIGIAVDTRGIPQTRDQRLELAAQIVSSCADKGFPLQDLYLDPILVPVNVAQVQIKDILETLREYKVISDPPPRTLVGLSNISQGACERKLINRTFAAMAIACGLDAAILDPTDDNLMDALITAELIFNHQIYCDSYLNAYRRR